MIKLAEGGIIDLWKNEKSPEVKALSYALQKAIQSITEKTEKTKCFAGIDDLDEKLLDYFAVEQRAMYYSQDLPIEQKRAIIKNTMNWYTKAGTSQAVCEMIETVLGSGKITEWFEEEGGVPGTFWITTEDRLLPEDYIKINEIIKKVKNVRSHLRYIVLKREVELQEYLAVYCTFTPNMIITCEDINYIDLHEVVGISHMINPYIILV